MRTLLALFLLASVASAADYPAPAKTVPDEPIAKKWAPDQAAAYLDGVGVNWTRDRKCVTCHTNMPYLMARPLLKGNEAGWKEVRKFLEDDVAKWADGGKPRGDAYIVATATGLIFSDGEKLSPQSRIALDVMWKAQKPTGEWNWLKCDWPPMEHDDYYGAVLAAIAVGSAPENYAKSDAAKAGLAKLTAYLTKNPAPDLHHQTHLLWASTKLDGLMTADEQKKTIEAIRAKQHADGGWSLPSFGKYLRRDKSPNDADAPSDGYATGLAVLVLRKAGVSADDPAIQKAVTWLKANQRESGRWYTRSLNNDKAHYVTNAGTAFAVMALAACGEGVAVASR